MPLYITSLNSGSNGNCYYVGNDQEAVLIDAGLSCRQTEVRMQRLGLSLHSVKAIFVSHEHSDHISGLAQLSGKYQIPVYITAQTLRSTRLLPARFPLRVLTTYEPVEVGELRVTAFPKQHDAVDPHSFLVEGQETKVGVFTDIGTACDHVVRHFSQCHAVFLEANYDEDLLANGRYPAFLKQRIRGDQGHLSNQQALALLKAHKPPFMSHVLLAHLSKDNNSPVVARDLFLPHMDNTELIVASRFAETPIYTVQAN
ncbi:MBL fold metallo-hydrolase [Fibrivirga algicola]|uniref:MBL fold metallo-hydrolase n=1 Tax=Fibrivirga algicola TaxID=2950420 RepID=A0ABX0QGE5_9BACT|nr:MBL fold metallo-hydrolase [Fibrivirga algicola]ARK11891.1 MBL fold metallo-hydrolase [Fibrella sp. ES10-3-2-2]NID11299.1 MBL fold metallo-hydrolase [Fibrivirga algicola]